MPDIKRAIMITLDSVGVGELPDADAYGDVGSNTVGNLAKAVGSLRLPTLGSLGLGNIIHIEGVPPTDTPRAAHGKMASASPGKDTTTGHWEVAGIKLDKPFPTYPAGFPDEVIAEFTRETGLAVLGNKAASGTEIIKELGAEHVRTGKPIVYTSADSVFQIAAHQEVIPLERLYEICEAARRILNGEHNVARVIARPFIGKEGSFTRTEWRRDFSVTPPRPTLLDHALEANMVVRGIGKIWDIFAGKGIAESIHTGNNREGMAQISKALQEVELGVIWANLVDFDMLWGHRNDVQAYANGLEEFDSLLPGLLGAMRDDDMLVIFADHGCDPTTPSTDHSREYVPLIIFGARVRPVDLGTRPTLADAGATIAEALGLNALAFGSSCWGALRSL